MLRAGESRNNVDVDAERNKERWIVARSEEQALAQAQKLLGTKDVTLERDEDVLDTCDLGVPRCCGAFTPSTRLVSIRRDRGWFLF